MIFFGGALLTQIFDVGNLGLHLSRLTPEEKAIRHAAFYKILNGNSASVDELAIQLSLSTDKARRYIKDMVDKGILVVDEKWTVVGSHGLSLIPTDHRLSINGKNLFTWCAEDAIGIPAALGVDAVVISKCYQCNDPIRIEMASGEVLHSSQQDVCIWVVEADLGRSIVGCT